MSETNNNLKIICLQENLIKGLQMVNHLAGKNTNLPILNNVLIEAKDGQIILTTTNLEIGINCKIRGKIEKSGKCTVQAKLITDFVSLLPKDNVILELKNNRLTIQCVKDKTTINTLGSEDFPLLPNINKKNSYTVNANDFKKALRKTIFAVSFDSTRPEIAGIFLKIEDKKAILVGTDSYRLAEKVIELKNSSANNNLIIPADTIHELLRIIGDETENDINFHIDENQILFEVNGTELVSRLVEGNYPDYKQIIPKNTNTTSELKVSEFVQAIKKVSLFCKPGINDVKINIVKEKGEIVLSSTSDQLGEGMTILNSNIDGSDNEIVFNYRYILDGLNNISSETIFLEIIDNKNAGLIKSKQDSNYLYIVMPIKQ
ncbi:DNA polymerase III subunit beta [bacterium]|nr:DNA polymerase III subunit beta [bacterium]